MTRSNKKRKVVKSLFIRKVLPKKIQYSKHNLFEKPSEGNKYNREFNLFSFKKNAQLVICVVIMVCS